MDALHQLPPKSGDVCPKATLMGHYAGRIEGSYRPITVHQLTLAWWLHASGHMTRRQLRVYFALHEMSERRRYAQEGREPHYKLDEVLHLVGGRGEQSSGGARDRSELSGDLRRLARLGLAALSDHHIEFATSADQIRLGSEDGGGVDDLSGFWTMFEQIPNRRRTVPVPRRMVRALAAGFSRATTALILALLIRGLFWHRGTDDSGGGVKRRVNGIYRTDGRYKLSWVARVFGVSRRSVSDARSTLIELGWIEPLEVGQVMMNRFGLHDRIVPDWKHPDTSDPELARTETAVGDGASSDDQASAASACPNDDFHGESASPDLTDSLPLTGNQYTRNPAPPAKAGRAGPAGVSTSSTWRSDRERSELGGRNRGSGGRGGKGRGGSGGPPNIRDIQAADLASTDRLLELHRQACGLGLSSPSEHGRLEFLALAERARTRGSRSGALFYWLLRERKTAFITLSDEDRAAQRLREHLNGPTQREADRERWRGGGPPRSVPEQLTEQERVVVACIRVAKKHRLDPAIVARQAKGWTRQAWDEAHEAFQNAQAERQRAFVGPETRNCEQNF